MDATVERTTEEWAESGSLSLKISQAAGLVAALQNRSAVTVAAASEVAIERTQAASLALLARRVRETRAVAL